MIATFREKYGCETIHAWGMTETSPLGTANQVKAKHDEGKIAKWQIPDAVVFVDAIPLSGTGKMLKTKLREKFGDMLIGKGAEDAAMRDSPGKSRAI